MPTNEKGYQAILAKSQALGWPKDYIEDLITIDHNALLKDRPTTEFWWIVHESGTQIMFPDQRLYLDHARACRDVFTRERRDHHAYHYDGKRLHEITLAQLAEQVQTVLQRTRPAKKKEVEEKGDYR